MCGSNAPQDLCLRRPAPRHTVHLTSAHPCPTRAAQIGAIIASISLPASVALDQLHWRAQRIIHTAATKAGGGAHTKSSTEAQRIAQSAMACALDLLNERTTILAWYYAVEDMKV